MAKDPAFLFYSESFLTGTMLMPFDDRGKYITILAYMHQNGRLSEETISLLVGSVSDILRLKFEIDERGFWYNERLEVETEKRKNFLISRVENGKKGGRPPKKQTKKPLGKANHNLPIDINKDNIKKINNKGVQSDFEKAFDDFLLMRKNIKKPATERAIELLLVKLEKISGGDELVKIQILQQSIIGNWQDVYELKNNNGKTNTGKGRPDLSNIKNLAARILEGTTGDFGNTGNPEQ